MSRRLDRQGGENESNTPETTFTVPAVPVHVFIYLVDNSVRSDERSDVQLRQTKRFHLDWHSEGVCSSPSW